MLYFNLNLENYKGKEVEILDIKLSFFDMLLKLKNINFYIGNHSKNPQFINYPNIYNSNMLLEAIDNEQLGLSTEYVINSLKKMHTITIPCLNKSLEDLGLEYNFIVEIPNREVENALRDDMAENNLQFAYESIGNTNMTLEEKIDFICNELKKIKAENQTLTIMDPYILPKKHDDDYLDLFLGFIEKSKIKKLKLITSSQTDKYNSSLHLELKIKLESLSITLEVFKSETLHDRRWLIEEKKTGFLCGPSLNGVGKDRTTTISSLSEEDIISIINNEILSLTEKLEV